MNERKTIPRTFDPPKTIPELESVLLDLAVYVPKLLAKTGWDGKTIKYCEVILRTEFDVPEAVSESNDSAIRLKNARTATLGFGEHANTPLDEVPMAYLEYLQEAQRDTQKLLDFYLKHPTIRRERDRE